jgi:PAT family acetyl-CoA transporter-like MFS transporter 1
MNIEEQETRCLESSKDDQLENNEETIKVVENKKKDIKSIIIFFILYTLQGIPGGLIYSIPLIMSSKMFSSADQGLFSFATWPYSLKILWAPIVDNLYIKKLGRRKPWIASTLFLTGVIMISFASYSNQLLGSTIQREKIGKIYSLIYAI